MNNTNNICFVMPSNKPGGMERVMSELLLYFSENKNDTLSLILLSPNNMFFDIPKSVKIHKPALSVKNKTKFIYSIKLLFFLRKTIQEINPTTILSFGEMYNSFVLLSCIFTNYKIFVSDRSRPNINWGFFHNTLRNYLYKNAAGIIAQTEYAKEFIIKNIKHNNVCVIGNPIRPVQQKYVIKKNIILHIGRLIKSKRIDLLIDIFSAIDNANWQIILVGDGPELNFLKKIVREKGFDNKILFEGYKKNVDIFYNEASIFAFTSNSEGFPNAIGEAMTASLPVICFDCIAGPRDLIDDGINGYLISNDNIEEYKSKLALLMNDEKLRQKMGYNAMIKIKKFDKDKISEKYYTFITK